MVFGEKCMFPAKFAPCWIYPYKAFAYRFICIIEANITPVESL
tara:strand:- start:1104 stop:1232 length:129 start_codon:yes stop_codon:yes gene_type:complete